MFKSYRLRTLLYILPELIPGISTPRVLYKLVHPAAYPRYASYFNCVFNFFRVGSTPCAFRVPPKIFFLVSWFCWFAACVPPKYFLKKFLKKINRFPTFRRKKKFSFSAMKTFSAAVPPKKNLLPTSVLSRFSYYSLSQT